MQLNISTSTLLLMPAKNVLERNFIFYGRLIIAFACARARARTTIMHVNFLVAATTAGGIRLNEFFVVNELHASKWGMITDYYSSNPK